MLHPILTLVSSEQMLEDSGDEIALVTCEASGGYEKLLTKTMSNSNYPFHVAHANKVRAFAKAKGWLAKTDKIDAQVMGVSSDSYQLSECKESIKPMFRNKITNKTPSRVFLDSSV